MFSVLVGCGCGQRNAGGCCPEWDWGRCGVVSNGNFGCPSIVHNFDAPESVLGVLPPSEDGLTIEGDFTTVLVEEDFASGIAEDGNKEEIVEEAGQSVGEACIGG